MRRSLRVICFLAAFLALGAGGAQAAVVTVGSPMTQAFTSAAGDRDATVANFKLTEPGARLTSPITGTIIRWRIFGADGGPYRLRVLRPTGFGQYTGAGTGPPTNVQSPTAVAVLPASLPIQTGDLLGLDIAKDQKLGVFKGSGMAFAYWSGFLADGSTRPPDESDEEYELAFNADVLPPPTLSSAQPARGSFRGGTTVTLSGTDLTEVSAVSFGGVPARSVTQTSETSLTAVAPAAKKPGVVDLAVTTPAGTATLAKSFSYKACKVPLLIGKTLKKARKRLRRTGCKLGKVKRHGRGLAKRIVTQRPPPGKLKAPGAKVKVVLGLG